MKKIKLAPVKISWGINPADDFLEYSGNESEMQIILPIIYSPEEINNTIAKLNNIYNDNIPAQIMNRIGLGIVEIKFSNVYYFDKCILQNNTGLLDENIYEFIDIPTITDSNSYNIIWKKKNICPDPGFYKVIDSKLKIDLNIKSKKIEHWVISGYNTYFNIIAKSFDWNYKYKMIDT